MLYNILQDFIGSPLNTTANIIGTGINIKFLDYCENFEKRLSPENKLLLEVSD